MFPVARADNLPTFCDPTPPKKPMNRPEALIISLLAALDALFTPIRDWSNGPRVAAIVHRRDQYARRGLPVTGGGNTPGQRKQQERNLDTIEATGLVTFTRRQGRRATWKLTEPADWRLRALCACSDWPETLLCLLAINAHEQSPRLEQPYSAVPEVWLTGKDYGAPAAADRFKHVEDLLAPALCRAWAIASSDEAGRVGYTVTDEGRAVLSDPRPPAIDWPEWNPEASEVYSLALTQARRELQAIPTDAASRCVVPLSSGDWPEAQERAAIPPVFTTRGKVRTVASIVAAIKAAAVKKKARRP